MSGAARKAVSIASIKGGTFYFNFKYRRSITGLFEREMIISHALPMIRNLHNSLSDLISAILPPWNENPPANTTKFLAKIIVFKISAGLESHAIIDPMLLQPSI